MNLLTEIDGKQIPLDQCTYVLWGPCGCVFGMTMAGVHAEDSIVTENDAWRVFYGSPSMIRRARAAGERMEFMTFARAQVEAQPKFGKCPHEDSP